MSEQLSSFDATAISASKEASFAREQVQEINNRVKLLEESLRKSESRLSSIETELANLKASNKEILSKLEKLTTRSDQNEGFFQGVKMTAKASGFVFSALYAGFLHYRVGSLENREQAALP